MQRFIPKRPRRSVDRRIQLAAEVAEQRHAADGARAAGLYPRLV